MAACKEPASGHLETESVGESPAPVSAERKPELATANAASAKETKPTLAEAKGAKYGGLQGRKAARGPRSKPKPNSTSTIFASSTITVPDNDRIILAMSTILHFQISRDEGMIPDPENDPFNELEAADFMVDPPPPVTVETIYTYVKSVFEFAQFSPECNVLALVYTNRLMSASGMTLHARNYRPIVLAALMLSQKFWDDRCLANVDFPVVWQACVPSSDANFITLRRINQLERLFLEKISYNMAVSSRLYAKYYFELRALCDDVSDFPLAPLSVEQSRRIEARSASSASWGAAKRVGPKSVDLEEASLRQERPSGSRAVLS